MNILLIDVGNSRIKWALLRDHRLSRPPDLARLAQTLSPIRRQGRAGSISLE